MIPFWDPFGGLAGAAGNLISQTWISLMLVIWSAGLWLLRVVLNVMDAFLTPDISETGPGAAVYRVTFWIGGTLMLILALVQLGVAALRRDGRPLAKLLIGTAQFAVVWAGLLAYAAAVLVAAAGLTTAFMESLLNVTSWNEAQLFTPFEVKDVTNGVLATVLGFMGLLLVIAAIGHFLVMLVRAAAIMILIATAPISAAGLVGDIGQSWFWKTMRWFHAAAFTPPLVVLVMGIGVQLTTGVAIGASGLEGSIGTALPGVLLICVSVVSPVALFKLLAFVDPGTATGAALRSTLAASGGVQGFLQGAGRGGGSSAASASTAEGRSAGEASAEDAQATRASNALSAGVGRLGPVGQALGAGIGAMTSLGQAAVGLGADLTNQTGVGHPAYYPDFTAGGRGNNASPTGPGGGSGSTSSSGSSPDQPDAPGAPPAPGWPAAGEASPAPSVGTPPVTSRTPPAADGTTGASSAAVAGEAAEVAVIL